jgi:hypothetical protein
MGLESLLSVTAAPTATAAAAAAAKGCTTTAGSAVGGDLNIPPYGPGQPLQQLSWISTLLELLENGTSVDPPTLELLHHGRGDLNGGRRSALPPSLSSGRATTASLVPPPTLIPVVGGPYLRRSSN